MMAGEFLWKEPFKGCVLHIAQIRVYFNNSF
jgi:hypothetical protein